MKGRQATPHIRFMIVRYRRGIRSDPMANEPTALPIPKPASTRAWSPGPPPRLSLIRNGISTSSGPITASTITDANSSVASSHGVRSMYRKPSAMSATAVRTGCRSSAASSSRRNGVRGTVNSASRLTT